MAPSSVGLYASPIQQVLVLQEEDEPAESEIKPDDSITEQNTSQPNSPSLSTNKPLTVAPSSNSNPADSSLRSQSLQISPSTKYRDRMISIWRTRDRVRTVRGLLVLCLHVGIDPQDVWKPNPCARKECWIEPNFENPTKSIKQIASALKKQYDSLHPQSGEISYHTLTDPTEPEFKKEYSRLRRSSGNHRVLFHYNGHGVPKPTETGEIWVFSSHYKYYIPINFLELQQILEHPTIYVFDCHSAGSLLSKFRTSQKERDRYFDEDQKKDSKPLPTPPHKHSLLLGACDEDQLLPMKPHLPADLFTSCLTSPLKTVLQWFVTRSTVPPISPEQLARIPDETALGTPMGDLRFIYRAITDCIAWNVFSEDLFKRLFRHDVFVASLVSNFLLAERIMRYNGCTPVSYPKFPETHNHPLWQTFDLAVEMILSQLQSIFAEQDELKALEEVQHLDLNSNLSSTKPTTFAQTLPPGLQRPTNASQSTPTNPSTSPSRLQRNRRAFEIEFQKHKRTQYRSPPFFENQLTAFEVWLDMGPCNRGRPEQLPMMLHALLNKKLHYKALCLLSRYLQAGEEAVFHALSVGIVPYLIKLLENASQSPISPKDSELVFLWSKILAADDSCRSELAKEGREKFFIRFIKRSGSMECPRPVYLAVAMFTLSVISRGYADRCLQSGVLPACADRLDHENPFVRRWSCLCLTQVVSRAHSKGTIPIIKEKEIVRTLKELALNDPAPDVRAAAVSTLSAVMNAILESQSKKEVDLLIQSNDRQVKSRGDSSIQAADVQLVSTPPNHTTSEDPKRSEESSVPLPATQAISEEEKKAMYFFGNTLADIARKESSVLVRREVSSGIATAVEHRSERFVRAAYLSDVNIIDEFSTNSINSEIDECQKTYCRLWNVLSELAFDPHPVVAAVVRKPYDWILETLHSQHGYLSNPVNTSPNDEADPEFSPTTNKQPSSLMGTDSKASSPNEISSQNHSTDGKRADSAELKISPQEKYGHSQSHDITRDRLHLQSANKSVHRGRKGNVSTDTIPPINVNNERNVSQPMRKQSDAIMNNSKYRDGTGFVSIRGGNVRIQLDSPLRYQLNPIPRTHSASVIAGNLPTRGKTAKPDSSPIASNSNQQENRRERPNPVKLIHALHGLLAMILSSGREVGRRTETQSNEAEVDNHSSLNGRHHEVTTISPPRPPRRNHSYQVLSTSRSISPESDASMFALSRKTWYYPFPGTSKNHMFKENIKRSVRSVSGFSDSEIGKAALSLYEWSSALIARVEFDATTTEYTHEEEGIPRYTTLWQKYTKLSDEKPMEERLRAFALSGEGDKILGASVAGEEEKQNREDHLFSKQLSRFHMAAGGGCIIAMTFLPRDIGMGDDQLLATGDSEGSVGVYDIRSGKCQGSFGIPSPPGIPKVGISSLLCLNTPSPSWTVEDRASTNSRSALILAGAYDGRVAVFKSDLLSPKYRIMTTFQASGKSYWSKIGTHRDTSRYFSTTDFSGESLTSSDFSGSRRSSTSVFADAMRDSGNGLVLAFDSGISRLVAGGCDVDIMRVWDLKREQCIWEASCVEENSWPTAVSMLKHVNPNIFVVGSSEGLVNMIDIRTQISNGKLHSVTKLGVHKNPIISAGICPEGFAGKGYLVVSADAGGEVAFWDPRMAIKQISTVDTRNNCPQSRAHRSDLTTMAVHPSGQYIASGSSAKCVKIFDVNAKMIRMITRYKTVTSKDTCVVSDLDSVTSLSFKNQERLLAVGGWNGVVMTFGDHLA